MAETPPVIHSDALARWYADPLSKAQADQRVSRAMERMRTYSPLEGQSALNDLDLVIGHFWQGRDVTAELASRLQVASGQPEQALLELVTGQLLASRKLNGAHRHLDQGFRLAAGHLTARDYLTLMNRHRRLRSLELSDVAGAGLSLEELLQEAAVVDRLRMGEPHRLRYDPKDTLG